MSTQVRPQPRLGPSSAGILMTPAEFDALPQRAFREHYRYELIRGVLVVTPQAGNAELDPNQYLGYLLLSHQETHPQGPVIDLTLHEQTLAVNENRRRCDRAIWVGLGRLPDPEVDVPAIVIEFVSQSRRDQRRDYEAKRNEYLAIGVREYWVIDRFRRALTVFQNQAGAAVERVLGEDELYATDLLPGFSLPLRTLLARADRWKRKPRRNRPDGGGA